jgi:hypothetical protein
METQFKYLTTPPERRDGRKKLPAVDVLLLM